MLRRAFDRIVISRGRDATSAAACITADYGDGWIEVDTKHPAYPRRKPGLGDMVAAGLSAVGITKARVEAVVGGPCGCFGRQATLNELGRKMGIG
jgi:hypothetical protein